MLWDLDARPHEIATLKIKHSRLKEQYGEGEIPFESKTGSGFIYNYTNKSYIITASNLVAGKNDITVILSDGSTYYSNLTGKDHLTNLEVLYISSISQSKLILLHLANSTKLERRSTSQLLVIQWVLQGLFT